MRFKLISKKTKKAASFDTAFFYAQTADCQLPTKKKTTATPAVHVPQRPIVPFR